MKNRKTVVIISIISFVVIVCILTIGGIFYLVKNNPQIGASFKQLASTFSDMVSLQQEILTAYPADDVQVGIRNGHILTISLVNSNVAKLSEEELWVKAKEIALFTNNHYSNLNGIDTIDVGFVQQNSTAILNLSSAFHYVIKLSELP